MKKYIGAILSLGSVAMLFYILFEQKEQIKNLKSQNEMLKSNSVRIESKPVSDTADNIVPVP
ncbi:hypothetical protein UFOVP449_3 [uncultured Caudovirales phage]|uniref:Uncharacterized protein n=1 Tax=uncultured Caudovirales phage TaxID=2100421 RepID=A0A6J5MB87_9CAUD|nr:hypothetical protein UFOVP449_3 [uncultured Caudovirales phage]